MAVGDVVDGCGVEEVQLLPAPAQRRDQLGRLEDGQVLGDGLPGHAHVRAELGQGQAAVRVEPVEQRAPGRIAQRPEDRIHVLHRTRPAGLH